MADDLKQKQLFDDRPVHPATNISNSQNKLYIPKIQGFQKNNIYLST